MSGSSFPRCPPQGPSQQPRSHPDLSVVEDFEYRIAHLAPLRRRTPVLAHYKRLHSRAEGVAHNRVRHIGGTSADGAVAGALHRPNELGTLNQVAARPASESGALGGHALLR